MIDQIILQYMTHLDSVPDICVKKTAIELLVDIGLTCMGSWFIDILDIFEKVSDLRILYFHLFDIHVLLFVISLLKKKLKIIAHQYRL